MDAGAISRNNIRSIDSKIQSHLQGYLDKEQPQHLVTLPEEVEAYSARDPSFRDLPLPAHTKWELYEGLCDCEQFRKDTLMNEKRCWLTETERWDNLPSELHQSETASLHTVLFGSHSPVCEEPDH